MIPKRDARPLEYAAPSADVRRHGKEAPLHRPRCDHDGPGPRQRLLPRRQRSLRPPLSHLQGGRRLPGPRLRQPDRHPRQRPERKDRPARQRRRLASRPVQLRGADPADFPARNGRRPAQDRTPGAEPTSPGPGSPAAPAEVPRDEGTQRLAARRERLDTGPRQGPRRPQGEGEGLRSARQSARAFRAGASPGSREDQEKAAYPRIPAARSTSKKPKSPSTRKVLEREFQDRWEAVQKEVASLKRGSQPGHPSHGSADVQKLQQQQHELELLAQRLQKKRTPT